MVVILNNFSFQLTRCMLNFRDAGIKKLGPLFMATILTVMKHNLIYNFGNDFYSVYNLIGLEDSCICDDCLTDFFCQFRLLMTYCL